MNSCIYSVWINYFPWEKKKVSIFNNKFNFSLSVLLWETRLHECKIKKKRKRNKMRKKDRKNNRKNDSLDK